MASETTSCGIITYTASVREQESERRVQRPGQSTSQRHTQGRTAVEKSGWQMLKNSSPQKHGRLLWTCLPCFFTVAVRRNYCFSISYGAPHVPKIILLICVVSHCLSSDDSHYPGQHLLKQEKHAQKYWAEDKHKHIYETQMGWDPKSTKLIHTNPKYSFTPCTCWVSEKTLPPASQENPLPPGHNSDPHTKQHNNLLFESMTAMQTP